jgi:hypothetical protein
MCPVPVIISLSRHPLPHLWERMARSLEWMPREVMLAQAASMATSVLSRRLPSARTLPRCDWKTGLHLREAPFCGMITHVVLP